MKRSFCTVVLTVLLLMSFQSAIAAVKYASFEELRETTGPATVQVVAKTDEPTNMHMKATLTARTTWRWLIQNEAGQFVPSSLYVDMDQYQAMSLSKRSFVLNHKECALTIAISASGIWLVTAITGVSKPISESDIGSLILIFLGMVVAAIIIFLVINKSIQSTSAQPSRQTQSRQPGKLFTAVAVMGVLSEQKKPKPKHQLHVGDLVQIKYRDQYGHIIDVNGGMYTVRFSNGRRVESYTADELSKV